MAANEILWLEAFLADPSRSLLDRYAVGCFLMAVYSRAQAKFSPPTPRKVDEVSEYIST